MTPALETHDLSKNYGTVRAVRGLALRVDPGEIYGFLGLNGAGKTTTIRMLLGMVRPTTGHAEVLGTEIQPGRGPWAEVGYLSEEPHAYPGLTVRENLEVFRQLRPGLPAAAIERALDRFGLAAFAYRRASALSHGNRQRLGLARAMMHQPRLLILDEPSNGLDPAGIVEIRELLRRLSRQDGVTVFLSSHILAEVARLVDRVGIIHHGRLVRQLTAAELQEQRSRWLAVGALDIDGAELALRASRYQPHRSDADTLRLTDAQSLSHPEEVSLRLAEAGFPPTHLAVETEDLEDYFLRLIGEGEPSA